MHFHSEWILAAEVGEESHSTPQGELVFSLLSLSLSRSPSLSPSLCVQEKG